MNATCYGARVSTCSAVRVIPVSLPDTEARSLRDTAFAFAWLTKVHRTRDRPARRMLGEQLLQMQKLRGADDFNLFQENVCPIHSFVIDRGKTDPADVYFDQSLTPRLCARGWRLRMRVVQVLRRPRA